MGKDTKNPHAEDEHMTKSTPKCLKEGPLDDRKCTDILCLIIFGLFWAGMIAVASTALRTGDPYRFTFTYDQNGQPCGQGAASEFDYLLFLRNKSSTTPYKLNNTACVRACPSSDDDQVECFGNVDCTGQGAQTELVFNRLCFPNDTIYSQALTENIDFGFFSRALSDLKKTWPMILAVGGIALAVGFIYLVLMKFLSGVLIWGLLFAFVVTTAGFGYICLTTDPNTTIGSSLAQLGPTGLKAAAYSSFAVAGISLLLVICLRERISLSIAVLKAATHFITDEPSILILPPIFFVLTLSFYVGWTLITVWILGTNDIKAKYGQPFANLDWTRNGTAMFTYYLFALLWNNALGVALSQFIIASSVCLWYFKQGTKVKGVAPIRRSITRSIQHFGSLAFGSFLIGLLQFIRIIMNYLQAKLSATTGGSNASRNFVFGCINCCFACFEKSLKFLTTHAYIQIAMTGENFCVATKEAFFLSLRNVLRFGMVHSLAWVFLFFGQLIIACVSTGIGYIIITQSPTYRGVVLAPIVPSIFFFLVSYLIAHVFMGIYGMTADTIVHCFAMDEEIHDGHIEHAPEELREFIDQAPHTKKLLHDQH